MIRDGLEILCLGIYVEKWEGEGEDWYLLEFLVWYLRKQRNGSIREFYECGTDY